MFVLGVILMGKNSYFSLIGVKELNILLKLLFVDVWVLLMLFFYRFGAKDIIWQFAFSVIARNYCQNINNNSSNPSEILSLSAEIGVYCFGVIVILKHLCGFLFSVFYLPLLRHLWPASRVHFRFYRRKNFFANARGGACAVRRMGDGGSMPGVSRRELSAAQIV